MSCSFKTVGSIADLDKIWECLEISARPEADSALPEDCLCAISPVADILVLARVQNICVLGSEWSTGEDDRKFQFHLSWTKNICNNTKETITAVIVLPVASSNQGKSKKSSNIGPEWTCIALGFSSGFIRFYNEVGDLLLSHRLHDEPLTSLSCQSYAPPRHSSESELVEELRAFFTSVLCVFPGFPLFTTLKAARNHLARTQSEGEGGSASHVDIPLKFHKWRFSDQQKVSNCAVVGAAPTNTYHHLYTASVCGGYNTSYKSSAPQSTQIIATGTKPYVGFHYAMEGSSHQIFTDVAKVVANKLKFAIGQAVPSWFLGGSKATVPPEETASVKPPEDMGCRFGLCDAWRQGIDVVLSPLRTTCIVTDFLGRMTLVDTMSGIAVRQWKGYRDAQTGWYLVDEDSSRSKPLKRSALFLVAYAPKRSVVEVWAMQQGPRVACFGLTQPGRLLYTSHGLMGMSGSSTPRIQAPLLFLSDNGVISDLDVPFHCILTEENSSRARDLHLLKKLRCAIRDSVNSESKFFEEANEVASNLRTVAVIRDALGYLTHASHITPIVLASFLSRIGDTLSGTPNENEEENQRERIELMSNVHKLQSITHFYEYICGIHDVPPNYTCVVNSGDVNELEDLSKKLSISKKELTRISNLITSTTSSDSKSTPSKKSVKFSANFIEYIQIFKILQSPGESKKPKQKRDIAVTSEDKTDDKIHIDPSASRESLSSVSSVMFQGVVYGSCSLTDFTERCKASSIGAEDLMTLALLYWSNKEHGSNIYKEMYQFSNVLKYVCILKESCDAAWWQSIRTQLSECSNPLSAMTGALLCRGVAIQWEKKLDQSETEDDIDWETYDQSSCQWSLLIGQLEDISILDKSTTSCIVLSEHALPCEPPHVTLKYVLKQGRGCVTELVARWLCACGFKPELVVDRRDAEFMISNSPNSPNQKNRITGVAEGVKPVIEESVEAKPMSPNEVKVYETLKCLKQHFPYSLSCSSVLAHMCWEYTRAYENNPHRLELLRTAHLCLEQIQSSHIKQGICYMLWAQHLRAKFESCLRLLHKVGKLPKELLCKQDLKLSDTQIAPFLQLFVLFFEQYIQANIMSETFDRPRIQYELFWEGQTRQSPTFVQLSLTQPPATYEILHLLLQATRAFYTMVFFNLKVSKPLNAFFDSTSQSALFTDIHAKSMSVRIHPDAKLVDSRRKFLVKAMSASIQLISMDLNPDEEPVYDVTRCTSWVTRILDLATEWSVPTDVLRRHQVCELYANGYDQLAKEITPLVSETSLLGSQLLLILGLRMKLVLQSTKNTHLKNTLSCLSPSIISWLESLKPAEEIKIEDTRLISIAEFSKTIVNLLPDDHVDRHMANLLAECLPQLVHNDTAR